MFKKRFFAMLLSICVMFAVMPMSISVNAYIKFVSGLFYDIYEYYIIDGDVTIVNCDSEASGNIAIPEKINGYAVTAIDSYAFFDCSSIVTITIPDGVTSIGDCAFFGCSSLTSISISDSVTSIGNNAFCGCSSLINIKLPNSLTSINSGVFHGCRSLTDINIPDGVTTIGNSAFAFCESLASITLPDRIISIGDNAFNNISNLKVYYKGSKAEWKNIFSIAVIIGG